MRTYNSIEEIKEANHRAGGYFFSPNTMRGFKTRVLEEVYGGMYFITSDKRDEKTPREYTIWEARESGDILKVRGLEWFKTPEAAKKKARELAAALEN